MALFGHHNINGAPKASTYFSPYLGPVYSDDLVFKAVVRADTVMPAWILII